MLILLLSKVATRSCRLPTRRPTSRSPVELNSIHLNAHTLLLVSGALAFTLHFTFTCCLPLLVRVSFAFRSIARCRSSIISTLQSALFINVLWSISVHALLGSEATLDPSLVDSFIVIYLIHSARGHKFALWLQVLESLGGTLYACLDYGLGNCEERALSAPLEHLISILADLDDQPDAAAASEAFAAAVPADRAATTTGLTAGASGQVVLRRLSTIDETHETSQSASCAPSPPPEPEVSSSARHTSRPAADGDEGIHDCYNPEPDADLVRSLLQVRLLVLILVLDIKVRGICLSYE